jgi:hypothetical protein
MELSPFWEATQEMASDLWNPKDHKGTPLVSILSHINPVHTPSYLYMFHFNIFLPSTSNRSSSSNSSSGSKTGRTAGPMKLGIYEYCHVLWVTTDGVWIGDSIYCTL